MLLVDVRTDFAQSVEFSEVTVEVGSEIQRYVPTVSENFLAGARVARFETEEDQVDVRVVLFTSEGDRVIQRRARAIVTAGTTIVTVVLSRSCENVECPTAGAPSESECDNGVCVAPECTVESRDACSNTCTDESTCAVASESCGRNTCREGSCLFEATAGACTADEACIPGRGCVMRAPVVSDAGVLDVGVADVGVVDVGVDAGMDAGSCVSGVACERPGACEEGVVDCSSGEAVCNASGPTAAGIVCRPASGECDVEEVCDGVATECPSDLPQPTGTACSAGFCNGAVCGTCSPGAPCTPGGAGVECAMGMTTCMPDGTPLCMASGFRAAGVECRAAAGDCDVAEVCNGTASACPVQSFQSAGVVCRAATPGGCDVVESCTGMGPTCPSDGFAASTVECRVAAPGGCDVAEECPGDGATCPVDGFQSSAVICRPDGGACDVQETCTGSSATCPVDAFESDGSGCGGETCGDYGICTSSTAGCTTGDEIRLCTRPVCGAGSCGDGPAYEDTRPCTIESGDACSFCLSIAACNFSNGPCDGACVNSAPGGLHCCNI